MPKKPQSRTKVSKEIVIIDEAGTIPESLLSSEPILLSVGMRKITSGPDRGWYQAFVMKTQGDKVVEVKYHQADVKLAASDQMTQDVLERFITNGDF